MISSFRILSSTTAKLGPLAIVMRGRVLLDRFLTVLNREDCELLCELRLLYFFTCRSVDCMWMFWDCSYVMDGLKFAKCLVVMWNREGGGV